MSEQNPKVAAIVPAYNEAKTVGNVVSVLKKSPLIDEIIVISDGSTDNTPEIAKKAGADLVHEFPWRHGKGAALQHGVTHTDAPIIFFLDADLIGLTPEHVRLVLEPVLSGSRAMNVGLRDRGPFWTWLGKYMPLIGGERALVRSVFENIPDVYLKGFKIESALNYYCRANHLPYGLVVMPAISIVRKMEKFGFWLGLWEYMHMYWQVGKAMVEVRMAREVFTTHGAFWKHKHAAK